MFSWYCLVSDGWLYKGCRERERERGHQSLAGHCPLQGSGSQGSRPGPPRPRRPRPRHRGAVHCCESQPPAGTTQDMGTRPAAQPGTDRNPRGAWLRRCDPRPRLPWLLCRARGSPGRGGAGAGATRRSRSRSHQQPEPPAASPVAQDGRERSPGQHECSGDVHAHGERSAAAAASHDAWGWFTTRQEPTEPTVTPVLQAGKSSPRGVKTLPRGS